MLHSQFIEDGLVAELKQNSALKTEKKRIEAKPYSMSGRIRRTAKMNASAMNELYADSDGSDFSKNSVGAKFRP